MRNAWRLLALLALAPTLAASYPELDDEALRLAAMAATPDFDFAAHARSTLRYRGPAAWDALAPGEQATRVAARVAALREQVAALPPGRTFTVRGFTVPGAVDDATRSVSLTRMLRPYHTMRARLPTGSDQLPAGFVLIVPNQALQGEATIDADTWARIRDALAVGARLYTEADLRLVALRQNRYFLAPIVELRYYLDNRRDTPIAVVREARPAEGVVAHSLLREGLTLDLQPIQQVELPGGTIHTPLLPDLGERRCEATGRHAGHLVVRCLTDLPVRTVPMRNRQWFVGGRLVVSDYFPLRPLGAAELERIADLLTNTLGQPDSGPKWQHSGMEIVWRPSIATDPALLDRMPSLTVRSLDHPFP